jgi:hypothetical protein
MFAKLVIAPLFVAFVTLVGRKAGPRTAGMLAGLPVVAGPALATMVLGHDASYAARAANAAAMGSVSVAAFALVYAHLCKTRAWPSTVSLAYVAFFVSTLVIARVPNGPWAALLVPAGGLSLIFPAFPHSAVAARTQHPSAWDLPLRMAATALLVFMLVLLSDSLGPELSGLLAPFPVITAVLAVFAHRAQGPQLCALLLRNLVRGLSSFVVFFVALGALVAHVAMPLAFAFATLPALGLHTLVLRRLRTH